jgi:hypothetical protein
MPTRGDALVTWRAALGLLAAGCGQTTALPPQQEIDTTQRPDAGHEAHDGGAMGATADASAPTSACAPGAELLYLMDTAGRLHSFDPTLLPSLTAFKTIGTMNCVYNGSPWAGANSMAIDRLAVAWVTDDDGRLFRVSTVDASCQATGFVNQHGFGKIGMGFAGNVAAGSETLYVVDNSNAAIAGGGQGLASIDLASLALNPIANFDGAFAGMGAELTGSGDGRLFGFFPVSSSLAQIDPATARVIASSPVVLSFPSSGSGQYDFAVSFWSGLFFFYTAWTANAGGPTTQVTAFDSATRTTTVVLPQIGFNVVGAGSSTCVPTHGDVERLLDGGAATDAGAAPDPALEAGRDAVLDADTP